MTRCQRSDVELDAVSEKARRIRNALLEIIREAERRHAESERLAAEEEERLGYRERTCGVCKECLHPPFRFRPLCGNVKQLVPSAAERLSRLC